MSKKRAPRQRRKKEVAFQRFHTGNHNHKFENPWQPLFTREIVEGLIQGQPFPPSADVEIVASALNTQFGRSAEMARTQKDALNANDLAIKYRRFADHIKGAMCELGYDPWPAEFSENFCGKPPFGTMTGIMHDLLTYMPRVPDDARLSMAPARVASFGYAALLLAQDLDNKKVKFGAGISTVDDLLEGLLRIWMTAFANVNANGRATPRPTRFRKDGDRNSNSHAACWIEAVLRTARDRFAAHAAPPLELIEILESTLPGEAPLNNGSRNKLAGFLERLARAQKSINQQIKAAETRKSAADGAI